MGGSILNADKLIQTSIEFSAAFAQFLAQPGELDATWESLAREIDVRTKVVDHNWIGDVPGVSEWKDERPIGKVQAENYRITTKRWANGLEVDEDDIEDDNLGLYLPRIQLLAGKFRQHKINLLMDFLVSGFATTKYGAAYDGVAFFGAHSFGNNAMTATLDDTGALTTAIQRMVEFRSMDGEDAGYRPTALIYGPSNQVVVDTLLESETLANGASNPNFERVRPIVSGKLVGPYANYWFLADLNSPAKPLIWQKRRDVRFRSVGSMPGGPEQTSYQNFLRGKLYFGADARYNAGYGFPQAVVGSNGTT